MSDLITSAQSGHFSASGFAAATLEGGAEGALGGGLAEAAGPLLGDLAGAAGRLLGSGTSDTIDTTAAEETGGAGETFYRTMSKENFGQLQATGRVSATSETFVSPSEEYASRYEGVTVKFAVRGGTQDALAGVGVRDASAVASAAYPDMPLVSPGWTSTSAFFKGEGGILNIGLGRGPGLDIFNDGILGYEVVP